MLRRVAERGPYGRASVGAIQWLSLERVFTGAPVLPNGGTSALSGMAWFNRCPLHQMACSFVELMGHLGYSTSLSAQVRQQQLGQRGVLPRLVLSHSSAFVQVRKRMM